MTVIIWISITIQPQLVHKNTILRKVLSTKCGIYYSHTCRLMLISHQTQSFYQKDLATTHSESGALVVASQQYMMLYKASQVQYPSIVQIPAQQYLITVIRERLCCN